MICTDGMLAQVPQNQLFCITLVSLSLSLKTNEFNASYFAQSLSLVIYIVNVELGLCRILLNSDTEIREIHSVWAQKNAE